MSSPVVTFDRVSYQYPNAVRYALQDVSFQVGEGEFFGIIGPTGAGKSTLCLTLNGIVPQFYGGRFFGKLTVMGLDSLETPISRLSGLVGQVFEDPESQLIATSVENEVAFTLENFRMPREEIRDRIEWALKAVRLSGLEKKHPAELSGGQKQRLAIAAAIAPKPRILVLDEPTSQLDPAGAEEVFRVMRMLNREFGITIVVASHASEEMAMYADRIALLDEGSIKAIGSPQEIYAEVSLLEEKGLRPPQVAQCFFPLRKKGLLVQPVPVKLEDGMKLLDRVKSAYVGCGVGSSEVVRPAEERPLISVQNLEYRYPDGTQALKGVSFEVFGGEYVLIAGQNGAGKSTLVKQIMGLFKPDHGRVLIDGEEAGVLGSSRIAKRIGYVSQNPDHQIFNATVEQEVGYALKILGYNRHEIVERVDQSLYEMGLEHVRNDHPLSLPRGDRARVVIAAVLAMKPETIIFDEPTTGQDYRGARRILETSQRLHQRGMTVLLVTHHLYLMPEFAQRMLIMGVGTILLDAPLREAYYQFESLRQSYLEPPQSVLLGGEMSRLIRSFPDVLTPAEFAAQFMGDAG